MRRTPHVHMVYVRLLTVPPIALGAWSMALVLWQPPAEYYYYFLQLFTASFRIEDPKPKVSFIQYSKCPLFRDMRQNLVSFIEVC